MEVVKLLLSDSRLNSIDKENEVKDSDRLYLTVTITVLYWVLNSLF